jgi:hypothetical protein
VANHVPNLFRFGPLHHDSVFFPQGHLSLDSIASHFSPAHRQQFEQGQLKLALFLEGSCVPSILIVRPDRHASRLSMESLTLQRIEAVALILAEHPSPYLYVFVLAPHLASHVLPDVVRRLLHSGRAVLIFGGIARQHLVVKDRRIAYLVTHCGWSTLSVDVAYSGHAVLLWPRDPTSDQGLNAKAWSKNHGMPIFSEAGKHDIPMMRQILVGFEANLAAHQARGQQLQTDLESNPVKRRDKLELERWIEDAE